MQTAGAPGAPHAEEPPARTATIAFGIAVVAVCAAGAVRGGAAAQLAALTALVFLTLVVGHRRLFAWRYLLATMILVILLIPIRRYELPGSLPFKLEPYRLLLALLAVGWVFSLLADRRTRLRSSFLDVPIVLVPLVALLSICVNTSRLTNALVSEQVWKTVMFLFSFVVFYFILTSVLRGLDEVDYVLKVLVGGGAIVALFAVIEARTEFNVFNHLQGFVPGLSFVGTDAGDLARQGKTRVLGSSQHPIALSAALIMLIPIAFYLAHATRRKVWWVAGGILLMAALATLSRTGVMMLLVVVLVFAWLRPSIVKRLLPLALPLLVAVHFVLPGTIGSFKELFFPEGGLIAEQAQGQVGSSRGASFRPGLKIVNAQPILGQGYATRITDSEDANAFIVDDEWLGTAMETGLVGVALWAWIFVRSIRRFGRTAKADGGDGGLLLVSLAAAVGAFAVGMATYDAFSFIQVTFLLFTLLALGSVAVRSIENAPRLA
jgi:polysaccharide biosynthesis protein PslJ